MLNVVVVKEGQGGDGCCCVRDMVEVNNGCGCGGDLVRLSESVVTSHQ